jgi:DNA-binding XRE family transcriptional regulator
MAKKRSVVVDDDTYAPVAANIESDLARWSRDPAFKAAYDALDDEFAVLDVLLKARHDAKLTQEDIAKRMAISQPALGRLESSLTSKKHSPTLATLRRYAAAVGCKLELKLTPMRTRRKPVKAETKRKA